MPGVQTCALRSEEHTSELQSHDNIVCRLLLEKKNRLVAQIAAAYKKMPHQAKVQTLLVHHIAPTYLQLPHMVTDKLSPVPPVCFFFFNDTATTEIYPLSLHDALPI